SFFETLARQTGSLAAQAPEFLRTHPVTVNRIAETRERAADYPPADVQPSTGYFITRARLKLLTSRTPEKALEYFLGQRDNPERVGDPGTEYGIALARLELGQNRQALKMFKAMVAANPEVIPYHTGLAGAQLAAGNWKAAEETYRNAMRLFPRNRPLTIRYAEALMQNDRPEEAHRILLDLYNQVPPTAEQVRQLALAASAAGNTADAHFYMAESHLLNGELVLASDQLRLALSIPGLDAVQRARFTSRLSQVQAVLSAQNDQNRKKGRQEH
ncbi:MAG TPA: tetratricopeptide repeat protein, partial [Chromatiales bacterium]|nr:tetratricopeptide repeat protein [Chromatiales bacterium]